MTETVTLVGPPAGEAAVMGARTLGGIAIEQAGRFPDAEALVFDDPLGGGRTARWTYRELLAEARRVARALLACGAGKGTRVGVLMGNRPEAIATLLGTALIGGVAVPLSTFSTRPELAYLVRHADIEVLVLQTRMGRHDYAADVAALCPAVADPHPIAEPSFPHLRHAIALGPASEAHGIEAWTTFLARGADADFDDAMLDAITAQVLPSDAAVIIYSSGTTDRPKGVLHCHDAVARQWWMQAALFGRDRETRVWCPLPLFWTAGLNAGVGATLAAGATLVLQEMFEPGAALALIERERVTEPHVFAHQARALEEHPTWLTADLSSCTRVFGKSVFTRHPKVTGDPTWNMPVGYGMSETASFFTGLPCTTPRADYRAGSYGPLLPGNELRVIDPDSGQTLGPGESGELIVRGPTLMEHYVKRTRAECFDRDGWFHTGDGGWFDTDGHVYFEGRRTEMIKTAGANVAPAEIEVQLQAFEPVKVSRVVGIPDERRDEIAVLCVTLREGAEASEEDIRSFLRERVAGYKVPRHILFFTDEEFPMNASGTKVEDRELIAAVRERLAR